MKIFGEPPPQAIRELTYSQQKTIERLSSKQSVIEDRLGTRLFKRVVAAVKFYGADEGWGITSGTSTAVAQANNVRLIDGYLLRNDSLS